ncbi:hypothetical protein [Pontiella sp.]|uniref:hypothetical protein n=1 Tax=Pontiella sp. TaxID=2837462 RepID=UPI00356A6D06
MTDFTIYGGLAVLQYYSTTVYTQAKGWELKARLSGNEKTIAIAADHFSDDGSGTWSLEWPGAATADLASADYTLTIIACETTGVGTELPVHHVGVRVVAADETDLRSGTKKTLDALIALRDGKATRDEMSRSYNGRSISRMGWEELAKAIREVRAEYQREQRRAAGKTGFGTVNYEF